MKNIRIFYSNKKKSYIIDTYERKDIVLDQIEYLNIFLGALQALLDNISERRVPSCDTGI